jgi:hypothetical protein
MKEYLNKITCLSLMTIIFAFISCNSETNENKIETTAKNEQQNIVETKDTSLYFIKRLLNCSPKEVERILGKPDSKIIVTNDCTYPPSCKVGIYQHEKYRMEYFKERLKSVMVVFDGGNIYAKEFLSTLNFNETPFANNQTNIRWKGIQGIQLIAIFPKGQQGIDYALIEVEQDYNEYFKIEVETNLAAQKTIHDEQNETRSKQIRSQFSEYDGSNKYVVEAVKSKMNDPQSFEHVSTHYIEMNGHIRVGMEFREKNSFGATILNSATVDVTITGEIIKLKINQ